ncbi:hypothetical protein LG3211_3781 [Lysobacter gummosus]|nr:hypothetical protein LG3211_3781 [Lysobacter gummosus]
MVCVLRWLLVKQPILRDVVLTKGIEPSTSSLPRRCSTD